MKAIITRLKQGVLYRPQNEPEMIDIAKNIRKLIKITEF